MLIQFHLLDHQPIEMTYEKICQIKCAWLCLCEGFKHGAGCIELVAVRPGQAFSAETLRNTVDGTAGTAVGISDQYVVVLGVVLGQHRLQPVSYPFGAIVQRRIEAPDIERRPLVGTFER